MSVEQRNQKRETVSRVRVNLCRRIAASALLGALTFVVPAIASAGPAPSRDVRVPRIDQRVFENVQRWASDKEESWTEGD